MHLKGLTNLRILILLNPQITDAGLVHLKGLTNLRELYLSSVEGVDSQITDAGIADLQKALPNCEMDQ